MTDITPENARALNCERAGCAFAEASVRFESSFSQPKNSTSFFIPSAHSSEVALPAGINESPFKKRSLTAFTTA